ncbi:MAG: hypothetical protein HWE07_15605, partial [Cytophagia bacterium]|nr:hypothetical protein [Cytophagia bacterium]
LIGIAFIVAIPLSYYAVSSWMAEFAYHISIGVLPFVLVGVAAMVTILLIVSGRSAKAAMSNPIKALRTE